MKSASNYIFQKLAAAGFAYFMYAYVVFLMNGMSFFELSEMLHNYWLWIAFYVYGIGSSIVIDYLFKTNYFKKQQSWYLTLLLYFGFGFLPFIIMFFPYITIIIIAGLAGGIAAAVFYIGELMVAKRTWLKFIFVIVIPALMLFMMQHDFTKKENWQAAETENSYMAKFTYFNGEHKIPIELKRNETLYFNTDIHSVNGAGYGQHVENNTGQNIGMDSIEESETESEKMKFTATSDGTYYIVITGYQMRGDFTVSWSKN